MPRPRLYYWLKPYVPWRIRLALRRASARRIKSKSGSTWPIDPSAAKTPEGWPGWPNGKQFSFVITHDVEGPDGLAKCRRLAEVEMEAGFRSSFNFIPEGPYSVPPDLRIWLTERGFEVGVHDLRHDGKLYYSRSKFRENANRINRYIQEWGAKGFRSGFMLHELDWIHDLNILYDSSTFDTDPFEPQPDPAKTIFPFWVSPINSSLPDSEIPLRESQGYIELPYTLPQDSTLFSVFQESSAAIWLKKLDWIVENKGMALINVHPDYVGFPGERFRKREFPVAHYITLLAHLKDRYNGLYWQPLPVELAQWYRTELRPQSPAIAPSCGQVPSLVKKRAAVLLYSYYPSDSRPRRAAEAMVEAGMDVDLLCLKESANEPAQETIRGVNVFRMPMRRIRGGRISYVWKYGRFFLTSLAWLSRKSIHRRYDVIHVHNMPDFLVFATTPQRLFGTRVILDLHDPMPELMTSIYGLSQDHWQVKLLLRVERLAIKYSDVTLTPNITFKALFASRSCAPGKIHIIMNSPEEHIFNTADDDHESESPKPNEFRIMHHGAIVRRHGIDFLIRAVAALRTKIPGIHLDIYGRKEPFLSEVLDLARDLGIAEIIHYHGEMTPIQVGKAIRRANLGIIPNRRSPFTETNFPTRIFEYLAMDRPVVAPATQGITDYFAEDQLVLFKQDDLDDLVSKIFWVFSNPKLVTAIVGRGKAIYRKHLWTDEKASFIKCVSELL
jgi:glycosyltransferase involved in cell wall biosynthesis